MADNSEKTETTSKTTSKWDSFKSWAKKACASAWLRIQLLWIWFIKNIMVILQLVLWTLVLITLFDPRIGSDTPFFGTVFAPIIMIKEYALSQETSASVWFDVITAAISTGLSVYCVIYKTKTIALSDIKSKNLKIALIQAGMYFDENGQLCKKVENVTKLDVNEDGKVGDTEIKDLPTEGVIKGTFRAGKELVTIMTADLDSDKDGKLSADKAITDADLDSTIETLSDDSSSSSSASDSADASEKEESTKKTNKMKATIDGINSNIAAWWRSVCASIRESNNPKLDKEGSEIGTSAKKEADQESEKKAEPLAKKVVIVTDQAISQEAAKPAASDAKAETEKTEIKQASETEKQAGQQKKKAIPANDKNVYDILESMK